MVVAFFLLRFQVQVTCFLFLKLRIQIDESPNQHPGTCVWFEATNLMKDHFNVMDDGVQLKEMNSGRRGVPTHERCYQSLTFCNSKRSLFVTSSRQPTCTLNIDY